MNEEPVSDPQPTKPLDSPAGPKSIWSLILLLGIAVAIGVLMSLVISFIRVLSVVDSRAIFLGLDGLRLPILASLVLMLTTVALVIWRRPKWSTIGLSALGLAVVGLVFFSLFRIESFYGNMVPRLTWPSVPEAEEQFLDFQFTRPVAVVDAPSSDPLMTSSHDFPGFLGAERDGVIRNVALDSDWGTNPPEQLWRQPIGLGWAGFAIVRPLAITQEQRGEAELVVAYDAHTGIEAWVHADTVRFEDEHGDGPRAVPTVDSGRVYSLGTTGLLNCLDGSNGRLIWQQQVLENPEENNLLWGMSGSPLVIDGYVIVTPGGGQGQAIKAYDAANGALVWSRGDDPTAYASPSHVNLAGTNQLLSFNGAGLRGYSPDGEPLWLYPWVTQGEHQRVNVAQPIVVTPPDAAPESGYVLVSSGYGQGMALVQVALDAAKQWSVDTVWTSKSIKSKMSNFVVIDGFIYGFDNGIFACLDLRNGTRMWKRGRYGHGQVLAAGGLLLIQAESGDVLLLRATPERHEQLGTLTALSDKTWNHAALAGDLLVVRNDREAACFRLPTLPVN